MANEISAIVGLGNPGPDYRCNRHNAGALWVQYLAVQHGKQLRQEKRFSGYYAKLNISERDVHLLFPATFMNRSGMAVSALSRYFKIAPENTLIAYDELDLESGVLRLKKAGGHGGHNGLRDIIKAWGDNKDFPRLRFGIGHPGDKSQVSNYVLSDFSKVDKEKLAACFANLDDWLAALVTGDWDSAMNHLHRKA